jgi:hypothetical protein
MTAEGADVPTQSGPRPHVVCDHEPVCGRRPDGWPECAAPFLPTPAAAVTLTEVEKERLDYDITIALIDTVGDDIQASVDAILPIVAARVQQAEAERDVFGREGDRLRRDWVAMRSRAEAVEAKVERVEALIAEWETVSIADEWDAADRWADAPAALRAALDAPR